MCDLTPKDGVMIKEYSPARSVELSSQLEKVNIQP